MFRIRPQGPSNFRQGLEAGVPKTRELTESHLVRAGDRSFSECRIYPHLSHVSPHIADVMAPMALANPVLDNLFIRV
jgi:hypothetical protein